MTAEGENAGSGKAVAPAILMVEDDENDALLIRRALIRSGVRGAIDHASDGEEALTYLNDRLERLSRDGKGLPSIILLDVKLPKLGGLSVLKYLKQHAVLKMIPTIVLTSSREPRDINQAYSLGANSYLEKPVSLEHSRHLLHMLKVYWFDHNIAPDLKAQLSRPA